MGNKPPKEQGKQLEPPPSAPPAPKPTANGAKSPAVAQKPAGAGKCCLVLAIVTGC
jgi:hypothetical protein